VIIDTFYIYFPETQQSGLDLNKPLLNSTAGINTKSTLKKSALKGMQGVPLRKNDPDYGAEKEPQTPDPR
jgi:hypothetical protein